MSEGLNNNHRITIVFNLISNSLLSQHTTKRVEQTMINRIHIENEATFNNEGVDIENLNAINIIYGAMVQGKAH